MILLKHGKAPSLWFCRSAAVAPGGEGRGGAEGFGVQDHPRTGLQQSPATPSAPRPELGGLGTAQPDAAQAAAPPLALGEGASVPRAARPVGTARGRGTGQLPSNLYSRLQGRKVSQVQSKTELRGVSGNSRAAYAKRITKNSLRQRQKGYRLETQKQQRFAIKSIAVALGLGPKS